MSVSVGERPPLPNSGGLFLLRVNFVLLTTVLTAMLALAIQVTLFRELGADGKGHYSLFTLATTIGSGVSTLGVGLANVYFLGQRRHSLPALMAGAEFLVCTVTIVVLFAVIGVSVFGPEQSHGGLPIRWFALSIPLTLQLALLAPVLQARHQFAALNAAAATIPAGTIAGIAVLALAGLLTPNRAIAVWIASYVGADIVAITAIGWRTFLDAFRAARSFAVLSEQIRFGLQAELGNILQLINYRFDLLVVAAFKNATAVGFYSVAAAVAESLWLISGATIAVLMPRLSSADDADAAAFAPFVCRTVLLINTVLALAIAASSPVLIELVFGSAAQRSIIPMLWLLPGVVALSGNMILSSYIFSRGRPILNTYSTATTVFMTLALDLLLIPRFDIEGAAIASSVAYSATFMLSLFWFQRLSGRSPWVAILVRPASDLHAYVAIFREARHRARVALARGA